MISRGRAIFSGLAVAYDRHWFKMSRAARQELDAGFARLDRYLRPSIAHHKMKRP
jgi:hypothetical protein